MSFYTRVCAVIKWPVRLIYRVKVIGAGNEPDEPYIMCANHSSFSDPIIASQCVHPQIYYVARHTLSEHAFLGFIFRKAEVINIHRGEADVESLKRIVATARQGKCIGIFPQGTRMRRAEPEPEQAEAGLGLIASMTRMPVLPVSLVTKRRMPGIFRRTYVVLGKPVYADEYMSLPDTKRKAIAEYLFSKVCEPFSIPFSELKNYDKDS